MNRLCILAALLCFTAPVFAQSPPNDDGPLLQTIQQQLAANPAFAGIHPEAHNGKVTLNGSVATKKDRDHAEDLVKSVPGVKGVKTHLRVTTAQADAPSRPVSTGVAASTSPATSAGESGASAGGGNASGAGSSNTNRSSASDSNSKGNQSGSQSSDPHLIARAQQPGGNPASQEPAPSAQSASSSADQDTSAYGNNTYDQQAHVAPQPPNHASPTLPQPSDSALQSQIEAALRSDPALSGSQLSVRVAGNQVELSGAVPGGKEKETAERLTRSYAMDRKVENRLAVAGQSIAPTNSEATTAKSGKNSDKRGPANSTASAAQPQ